MNLRQFKRKIYWRNGYACFLCILAIIVFLPLAIFLTTNFILAISGFQHFDHKLGVYVFLAFVVVFLWIFGIGYLRTLVTMNKLVVITSRSDMKTKKLAVQRVIHKLKFYSAFHDDNYIQFCYDERHGNKKLNFESSKRVMILIDELDIYVNLTCNSNNGKPGIDWGQTKKRRMELKSMLLHELGKLEKLR